jgi:pyridoxal phosphate enzyme (YggS family)
VSEAPSAETIAANLAAVREGIARAAAAASRAPESIRLIAVSKTFGVDAVRAAIACGQYDFGENRVQEALPKIAALANEVDIRWHLIGHLQSNKARKAARPFDVIHSIDSIELLNKVDQAAYESRRTPEVLVQVDLAGEATKHGATRESIRRLFDAAPALRAVRLTGLMILPPWFDDPEQTRPYFRELRALRDTLARDGVPQDQLRELSMGMSHDFEVAIAEGATMIRVGTAIFGPRTAVSAER